MELVILYRLMENCYQEKGASIFILVERHR